MISPIIIKTQSKSQTLLKQGLKHEKEVYLLRKPEEHLPVNLQPILIPKKIKSEISNQANSNIRHC